MLYRKGESFSQSPQKGCKTKQGLRCDENACNIGISVGVGIAKTCAAFGGVTCVFTGWSTLGLSCVAYAACKVAGVVDKVGKSACNLCGKDQSQEEFSAGQLRNLTEQVFESQWL